MGKRGSSSGSVPIRGFTKLVIESRNKGLTVEEIVDDLRSKNRECVRLRRQILMIKVKQIINSLSEEEEDDESEGNRKKQRRDDSEQRNSGLCISSSSPSSASSSGNVLTSDDNMQFDITNDGLRVSYSNKSKTPVTMKMQAMSSRVDALTTKRGEQGAWVVERPLTQLLIELSGGKKRDGVIVIAATNRPERIDPALLRAGRFGKKFYIPLPNPIQRYSILKSLARHFPIDPSGVDLNAIAEHCENYSGADLESLVKQAAFAAFKDRTTIKMVHFEKPHKPSLKNQDIRAYDRIFTKFEDAN